MIQTSNEMMQTAMAIEDHALTLSLSADNEFTLASADDTLSAGASLALIAGDASDRKFYRLTRGAESAICMEFPKWEGGYGGDPLSWLGMHQALDAIGVPVPRVLKVDEPQACIWTEDFGDAFLNHCLGERALDQTNAACKSTLNYYLQALDLLVDVQYPATQMPGHPALERAFDSEKLMFEMNFFVTHFAQGFLELDSTNPDAFANLEGFNDDLARLCKTLSDAPRVLCHRDYHVRNVMIVEGRTKWIDFQDARMGPHTYDVVSLVRDSYVRITQATRVTLMRHYHTKLNEARHKHGLQALSWESLEDEALHMGLQRNIKALGSFGYLATRKNKPSYLSYVFHTLDTLVAPEHLASSRLDLRQVYPHLTACLQSLATGALRPWLADKISARGVKAL